MTKKLTDYLKDPNMVAHILAGSWAKIIDLEGNFFSNTLGYLNSYLYEKPQDDQALVIQSEIAPLLKAVEQAVLLEKIQKNNKVPFKEQIENLHKIIVDSVNELKADQVVLVSHERELENFVDKIYRVTKSGNVSKIENL